VQTGYERSETTIFGQYIPLVDFRVNAQVLSIQCDRQNLLITLTAAAVCLIALHRVTVAVTDNYNFTEHTVTQNSLKTIKQYSVGLLDSFTIHEPNGSFTIHEPT